MATAVKSDIASILSDFQSEDGTDTQIDQFKVNGKSYSRYTNSYWTSKQRQGNRLHEVAYRACFKSELPRFFISFLTEEGDWVYDPFSGRGTTVIEAALLGRNLASNDINPLSKVLCRARLFIPNMQDVTDRLSEILSNHRVENYKHTLKTFYHPDTELEIAIIRDYLGHKEDAETMDYIDHWIRMVATNRLTGHSNGFFSVYTLPPNQAVTVERQQLINKKRKQKPEYRSTKDLIVRKSRSLISQLSNKDVEVLNRIGSKSIFTVGPASDTQDIPSNSIQLTVTSPPFLDIVQYAGDNWLRCWFNNIDAEEIGKGITMSKTPEEWETEMTKVFKELYRITTPGGHVIFEVGEVKKGTVQLEDHAIPAGESAGFEVQAMMINEQTFTKTANIWGVDNNKKGTNTNRIIIFKKVE